MPVMRNAGGYVRVFRSMLDWEWYDDTACVRLMLHLLLTVNWEAKQWHGQTIQPGQLVTSMDKLAETLGTTRSAIRRTMDKLKSSGEVTIQTNNHWTTVTLGNWAEYQEVQPTNGRPKSQPTTNQRPTNDRPPATTKEGKEGNQESIEERKVERVALLFPSWSGEPFKIAWERWRAYKAEQGDRYKPIGEQAILSKLAKEYTNDGDFITAMEHSMANGWKGIFKPRNTPTLNIGGGMTKEQADEEMRQIRIKYGRDPVMGWVGDEECSRPLLIYMGRIKERKAV